MLVPRHYKTERASVGRILAYTTVYAVATAVLGITAVLLMLILAGSPVSTSWRWLGFCLSPMLFCLCLYGGFRLFTFFSGMFMEQHKGR